LFFATGYKYEPLIDYSIKVIKDSRSKSEYISPYGDLNKKFYNVEFDPGSG
jgi:hypothetical protein